VMVVDVAIALGTNLDVDEGMTRQLIKHMIKETDAGGDIGNAGTIEVEADLDARLFRFACDRAPAHRFLCLEPLCTPVIAR
jgi:hypothetical protein